MSDQSFSGITPPVSSLPRSWENSPTFADALYEWMGRAPWLAISALAHLMAFLLLAVVPWGIFNDEVERVIQADVARNPVDLVEVEPPEPEPPVELSEPDTDPELVDTDYAETEDVSETIDDPLDDIDQFSESPFDADQMNEIIGIGGGAKYGERFKGGGRRGPGGGRVVEQAVKDGLEWLIAHQHTDGHWDSDGFDSSCGAGDLCGGPGQPEHDIGVTGLSLLALLGEGHTTRRGLYREQVARAAKWLLEQQDPDNGLLGDAIGHSFMYDHAIATLALCECYYFSRNPIIGERAQKAVGFITTARNPYGVWRYSASPDGNNDTSVTGWMILALKSAQDAGLKIDSSAFADAASWFDEVTDQATGRVGYTSVGSPSSRIQGVNDHFPVDRGEAMTAVGLFSRFFLGQDPEHDPVMTRHADLLLKNLPEWDPDGLSNDAYYWYYGSYAMYQMGGRHWRVWRKSMEDAVLASQRKDGHARGSWDPIGPWGFAGGRVYSTAMLVLCIEVYFRYPKIIGAR